MFFTMCVDGLTDQQGLLGTLHFVQPASMSLNPKDPLVRQRELSPILLMRNWGPERGKHLPSVYVLACLCVCFGGHVQEGERVPLQAWIPAGRGACQFRCLEGRVPAHCPCMESLRLS